MWRRTIPSGQIVGMDCDLVFVLHRRLRNVSRSKRLTEEQEVQILKRKEFYFLFLFQHFAAFLCFSFQNRFLSILGIDDKVLREKSLLVFHIQENSFWGKKQFQKSLRNSLVISNCSWRRPFRLDCFQFVRIGHTSSPETERNCILVSIVALETRVEIYLCIPPFYPSRTPRSWDHSTETLQDPPR